MSDAASGGTEGGSGVDDTKPSPDASGPSYECNICLDMARDAVVSMCGHLFCWPCLHEWLETRPTRQTCPVCKAAISRDKVIPLYGRGSNNQQDPRDKVPPRPRGRRTEPDGNQFGAFNFGNGGFQMSFGIGAFPFGFFTSTFNINSNQQGQQQAQAAGPQSAADETAMNKLFLAVAIFIIMWIIFV